MSQPAKTEIADNRQRIIVASTKLMAAKGFDATSIQAIADAVGVRKQSVLYYFSTKESLREAVLEALLLRWNDVLPNLLMATAKSGLAKFDSVIDELLEFFARDVDRARLLVREILDRPDEFKNVLRKQAKAWVEIVASFIRKGQESGQIRSNVDPEGYVLQTACVALTALGTAECTSALFPNLSREEILKKTAAELKRSARHSLFVDSYLHHQESIRGSKEKET
ncbi:MAG: TetR/AcrR family transcriptional regulator [Myxococcota bacterium]|nr:TetR/AcrR family transcriptional regulator [Myxococcota bacterium]